MVLLRVMIYIFFSLNSYIFRQISLIKIIFKWFRSILGVLHPNISLIINDLLNKYPNRSNKVLLQALQLLLSSYEVIYNNLFPSAFNYIVLLHQISLSYDDKPHQDIIASPWEASCDAFNK